MTNRVLQSGAFTARPEYQSFPWSNTTGNESRNDAFKKRTSYAAGGLSEDRAGFHPGQYSLPSNAAHTAMATGKHQATGSAREHRATTTRAAAPESKT